MKMENLSYTTASESIIWEKIGKQIVIADLTTGKYCCIENESGTVVWEHLLQGLTYAELIKTLSNYYINFDDKAHEQVALFIKKLTDISVLVVNSTPSSTASSTQVSDEIPLSKIFKEPALLIYSDLDTLLMIDPIDDDLDIAEKAEEPVT